MGLFDTFGRALVWQGTREMFYQARHRRPTRRQPVPRQHPANDEVIVTFECGHGHRFLRSFDDVPSERAMAGSRCPDCGSYGRWLTFDYHRENPGG